MWYEIFKFELKYRAKSMDTYVFFGVVFLLSLVSFSFIFEGEHLGLVKENAPYYISKTMAIVTGMLLMIASMIMGVPVLRDYQHKMESLLFVNPIRKRDYLIGRFMGSFVVLIFVFSGLIWGMVLGEYLPWRLEDNLLPFRFWNYLYPFLTIVLPTLFFAGSIFFVTGTLTRNLMVVYTQGIFFFLLFILSRSIDDPMLSSIIEPFATTSIDSVVAFWSAAQRNANLIPFEGVLMYNRIFWVIVGVMALLIGYFAFNFNVIKEKKVRLPKVVKVSQKEFVIPNLIIEEGSFSKSIQVKEHTLFYLRSILQQTSFWSIVICGMIIIYVNSISLSTEYGVDTFPTTYLIIEELIELSILFFLVILVFYSGELIWKERDAKTNLIYDALPISNFTNLTAKFISLILIYIILIIGLIFSGILFQTTHGYYNYELGVYASGFFLGLMPELILYTFVAFFVQAIFNAKYIGQALVLFLIFVSLAMNIAGIGHGLINFGSGSLGTYSDMNGYSNNFIGFLSYKLYWLSFSVVIFVFAAMLITRGLETSLKTRLLQSKMSAPIKKIAIVASVSYVLLGGFIFYNTNILNKYMSMDEQLGYQARYEKTLKKYESTNQPQIVDVNLNVALYPKDRGYTAEGFYWMVNKDSSAIGEIHVQKLLSDHVTLDSVSFNKKYTQNNQNEGFGYSIYQLDEPMEVGDSIKMKFKQSYETNGFEDWSDDVKIVHNGIFMTNDHLPSLGYNKNYEIEDKNDRKKYGLTSRTSMPKIDDKKEVKNGKWGSDGYEIDFEIVLSTDASQTAIAPGDLLKSWTEDGRNYYHYRMASPMINFYAIVSAEYEVLKDRWHTEDESVDLEIYHHPGHDYNVDRIMEAMKMSLDYFGTNFSSYQYHQMRIMEFPRYRKTAQSFPNTVSFSEALGFIFNIDDKEDVDMAFYITAHEMAHQWWGLQVVAGNVQGRLMILESLSQYSAYMVLKEKYGQAKVHQFIKMELDGYLRGRLAETEIELPISLVEKQEYVYYRKGGINLYALQDYISEDSVNVALKRFIKDWNSFDDSFDKDRYATSKDLLEYFRAVTPDSLQYLITDLFETVTTYDNKVVDVSYTQLVDGRYQVDMQFEVSKYRTDEDGVQTETLPLSDYIDIGVFGENGELFLKKHKITDANTRATIVVDERPTEVGVDPYYKLIDTKPDDNRKEL